ncbi:MAG: leucine-rich repeat domain-containing protein [Promethearchaeota archaeon]
MEPDRAYYTKVFGFDPVADRRPLNKAGTAFRYEAGFRLRVDPVLDRAGVSVWARVDVTPGGTRNRVVFKRGASSGGKRGKKRDEVEAAVECVHTAVTTISVPAARQLTDKKVLDLARSTEFNPVELSPEEHFASLKSYVGGIAELGIGNLMRLAYYSQGGPAARSQQPFGFNTLMQKQVVAALHEVSPGAARRMFTDLILELAENSPAGWLDGELAVFDGAGGREGKFEEVLKRYGFFAYLRVSFFPDPNAFEALASNDRSWRLGKLAARFRGTHPAVLEQLALDEDLGVRTWVEAAPGSTQRTRSLVRQVEQALREEPTLRFNGVKLRREEALALARVELATGKTIPPVGEVTNHTLGFVAEGGHVVQLGLHAARTGDLDVVLAALPRLEVLGLRWNRLRSLPRATSGLDALRALFLGRNRLSGLPKFVGRLQRLEFLNLARNKLATLPPVVRKLPNLKKLDISGNEVTQLPGWLGELGSLEHLKAGNNRLTAVPGSLGDLSRLERLILAGNQLSSLPDDLSKLGRLEELDLAWNQFREVPSVIRSMTSLRLLDISDNLVGELPDWIGTLNPLRTLRIARNRLKQLSQEIGALLGLRHLDLRGNLLSKLPRTLGKLVSLRSLDLGDNKLADLPPELEDLVALRGLDLSGNHLETLPDWVESLANLTILSFSNNRLKELPAWLGDFRDLRKLDASGNQVGEIPPSLLKLKKVSSLYLFPGNKIKDRGEAALVLGEFRRRGVQLVKK